jgi:hypothetical protein
MFKMKYLLSVLFTLVSYYAIKAQTNYSTCNNAAQWTMSISNNFQSINILPIQNKTYIEFIASSEHLYFNSVFDQNGPNISSIELMNGNCNNLNVLEAQMNVVLGSPIVFQTALNIGQTYFLCLTYSSIGDGSFEACLNEKSVFNGTFFFTDQNGNIQTCGFDIQSTMIQDSIINYQFSCDGLTFCKGDTVCIQFSTIDLPPGPPNYLDSFNLLSINGQVYPNTISNIDFKEICVVFNQSGSFLAYLHPYDTLISMSNTLSPPLATGLDSLWNGACQSYFQFNIIDSTLAASANFDSTICLGELFQLTAVGDYDTITQVSIDQGPFTICNNVTWNTTFNSVGQHIIKYMVKGKCGISTYNDTILVVKDSLYVSIDSCNNITFLFKAPCTTTVSTTLVVNQNNFPLTQLGNGDFGLTMNLSMFSNPIIWQFNATTPNNPPTTFYSYYSSQDTFNINLPQNINILGSIYLCELETSVLSINNNNYQNITWTTSPVVSFQGQGTSTLHPINWSNTSPIIVSVTASTNDGCLFNGIDTIQICCQTKLSDIPYFVRTYVSTGVNSYNIQNQIPSNYYNGPNLPIAISLPLATNQTINTSYSSPTLLSAFINANPSIYNAGSNSISTSKWIFLNNDLIIDQNISFFDCPFIRLAPNATIKLNNGFTLSIVNSTLANKCNEMWGGIQAQYISNQILLRQTNIISAKTGINIANGAIYKITNSKFIDNYTGISIHDYLGSYASDRIMGCYFGDTPGYPLLAPHQNENQAYIGIEISQIGEIVIGTEQNYEGNLFHRLHYGIKCSKSNLHSYRNNFWEIYQIPFIPNSQTTPEFCAISARGFGNSLQPIYYSLYVGNSNTNRNNFLGCDFGIISKEKINTEIGNNYFSVMRKRGISLEDHSLCALKITNNEINGISLVNSFGIYVKNYAMGNLTITNNSINSSSTGLYPSPIFGVGIYTSGITNLIQSNTLIENNTIKQTVLGIWCLNIRGAKILTNDVRILFNSTYVNSIYGQNYIGISIQNSMLPVVKFNTVEWVGQQGINAPNSKMQGIKLANSPAAYVYSNEMSNTPVGFYAFGNSHGSRVYCNTMNKNRNGFLMYHADISDQGSPAGPNTLGLDAHNKWYYTFSDRTAGSMSQINLYYHSNSNELFSKLNNLTPINAWQDLLINNSSSFNVCLTSKDTMLITETLVEKRHREWYDIASGNLQYDSLNYQNQHFVLQACYAFFKEDSSYLHLNVPEDSIYQQFISFHDNNQTQTKRLYDTQVAMVEQNYYNAFNFCSSLNNTCILYNGNREVQELRIDRRMNDSILSSADTLFLKDIACLDPVYYGSAVYQAMAMIDWYGDCAYAEKSSALEPEIIETLERKISLTPNPSEGPVHLLSTEEMKKIVVHSLHGQELFTFNNLETNQFELNLPKGLYFIDVVLKSGNHETFQVIIL